MDFFKEIRSLKISPFFVTFIVPRICGQQEGRGGSVRWQSGGVQRVCVRPIRPLCGAVARWMERPSGWVDRSILSTPISMPRGVSIDCLVIAIGSILCTVAIGSGSIVSITFLSLCGTCSSPQRLSFLSSIGVPVPLLGHT